MIEFLKLNLQLFAEGGDGGSEGGEGTGSPLEGADVIESGENVPSSIPDRAKDIYRKAQKRMNKGQVQNQTAEGDGDANATAPQAEGNQHRRTYAEMIASDEYKDEHEKYMQKTIGERLKKYKGLEESSSKAMNALSVVASKYGLDPQSETFLDDLTKQIDADTSYFENYAIEHDISTDEAKRIVTLEQQVKRAEAQKRQAEQEESARQQIAILNANAERTKARFPDFDLATEMQDERFRRLCAVNNGDTTAAYMACHWEEVMTNVGRNTAQIARQQASQAVASNARRPMEAGLGNSAPSVNSTDFSKMNLAQLRAYADEQRRKRR